MTNINNLKPIENKKPVETVYELKNEIPSFEEFMKNYNENEKISDNYQGEFESYEDVRVIRSYGPGNGLSTEGEERAKKISKWTIGGFLAVGTILCPPAGIAAAAATGAAAGGAKIAANCCDEDSKLKEAFDTTSEIYADGVKKGVGIYTTYKRLENKK